MDENQKKTLLKWRARCKRSRMAHNNTAITYRRFHLTIGSSLILLTATASRLTSWKPAQAYECIPLVITIIAALVAAFQTFIKFSEQAETHRSSARLYGEVKKEIEFVLGFSDEIDDPARRVDLIREKEVAIGQDSPNALKRHWSSGKEEILDENEKHSVRNSA